MSKTRKPPLSYRGFEIDVYRERSLGGDRLTYYSVFRESDQLEITSGFSYDMSPLATQRGWYKKLVDRLLDENDPDGYLADDEDDPLSRASTEEKNNDR